MRKVLILTYYWPPAGGPGVQRVLKFAKYLPEFGWQPVILTVENGDYPAIDNSLVPEIPENIQVYKTKTIEPFGAYRKMISKGDDHLIPTYVINSGITDGWRSRLGKWIRANLFLPDARRGWIPFARRAGHRIVESEGIDVIFSSSPPHSLQLIGQSLAKQTRCKWVADLRDPWTEAFWQRELTTTALARYINSKMERSVLNSADVLVTVSNSVAKMLRHKTTKECCVIPNGFDAEDFKKITRIRNAKFTITYSGSMAKDQPIGSLLKTLKGFKPEILARIRFNIYGSVHEKHLRKIAAAGLTEIVTVYPYLPHYELISRIVNSEMLLLVIPDTPANEGILTGKIFEYIATGNFILGIGPQNGDAANVLKETGSGVMYPYSADLEQVLLDRFRMWQDRHDNFKVISDVEKYSRHYQTGALAKLFERLLA